MTRETNATDRNSGIETERSRLAISTSEPTRKCQETHYEIDIRKPKPIAGDAHPDVKIEIDRPRSQNRNLETETKNSKLGNRKLDVTIGT